MGQVEAEDEDLQVDEVLKLMLGELREVNSRLSNIESELQNNSTGMEDIQTATDDSVQQVVSAVKGSGFILIVLLGLLLWRLW